MAKKAQAELDKEVKRVEAARKKEAKATATAEVKAVAKALKQAAVRAHPTPCHTVAPSPSVDVHDVVTRTRGRNCSYRDSPVCCCANHSTTRRGVGGTTSR